MAYITAVCAFFAVAITAAIIYFFFKYRRKHPGEVGVPIHGDMRLETAWIVVPLLLADLEDNHTHWFGALRAITGANPVPVSAAGNIPKMAEAWLRWANDKGYRW